mmetsp:Transcript_5377/g.6233  ORF Transcript_5377/g.6233 Transcript_5377/m.6233 type:complete len:276 (-) Transcript_5377:40-867(-)
MAVLNSNPEILLRKRKNNDRKRLEKQEQARQRQLEQKKKNDQRSKKFVRAETLVSNYKSNELENKRIKHITKFEKQQQADKISQAKENDESSKLLFIIRIPDHTKGLKIPSKARKVLQLLRLNRPNTGVFVKLTPATVPLLKLISPYIVAGKPSLNSIRKLFQKRACISVIDEETKQPCITKLDNNGVVEDKFGEDLGCICIEDLIHELVTLGEHFKIISNWILPFKLNAPVSGWGPQAKLAKLQYSNEHQRKISLAGDAKLNEIDIDQFIDEQN